MDDITNYIVFYDAEFYIDPEDCVNLDLQEGETVRFKFDNSWFVGEVDIENGEIIDARGWDKE